MKRTSSISSLLGITQQEIAMLLGVSRSLWSLYELGQRDLPLPAQQQLAKMLVYVQTADAAAKQIKRKHLIGLRQLEQMVRENEYQRKTTAAKLAVAKKKHAASERLAKLSEFLSGQTTGDQELQTTKTVLDKASKREERQLSEVLALFEHQMEMLELEKIILDAQLRKWQSFIDE